MANPHEWNRYHRKLQQAGGPSHGGPGNYNNRETT
jgi:hypothetical protein